MPLPLLCILLPYTRFWDTITICAGGPRCRIGLDLRAFKTAQVFSKDNRKEQRAEWLRQPSDTQQQTTKKVSASGQFSDRIFPRHLGFGSTSSPFGGGTTGSSGGGLFGNTSSSFGSGGGMHLHELFPFCMDFAGFLAIWTSSGALSITIFLPSSLEGEPKLGALHGFRNSRNTFISTSRLLAAGNLYRSTHLCFYVDSRLYM